MLINEARRVVNLLVNDHVKILLACMLRNIRQAEFLVCAHGCGSCRSSSEDGDGNGNGKVASLRLSSDGGDVLERDDLGGGVGRRRRRFEGWFFRC